MLRGQVAGLGGAVQLDGFVLEVGFFSNFGLISYWAWMGGFKVADADYSGCGRISNV